VELDALCLDELRQFGSEFDEDFYKAVMLDATLDCHNVIGGTATARVKTALTVAAGRVAALRKTHAPEVTHAGA